MRTMKVGGFMLLFCLMAACQRYDVIPEKLEKQVARDVTYEQIKDAPSRYSGQLVVVGGQVLSAKRLDERTRIEVLQLPLNDALIPLNERTRSNGRFIADDRGQEAGKAGLDPAIVKEGTPVTIVGEVVGQATIKIDESEQQVPQLRIADITVWDQQRWERDYAHYRPYGGYPYWGAYPYRYGY